MESSSQEGNGGVQPIRFTEPATIQIHGIVVVRLTWEQHRHPHFFDMLDECFVGSGLEDGQVYGVRVLHPRGTHLKDYLVRYADDRFRYAAFPRGVVDFPESINLRR